MLRPVRLTRGVPTTGALEATPTICLHQHDCIASLVGKASSENKGAGRVGVVPRIVLVVCFGVTLVEMGKNGPKYQQTLGEALVTRYIIRYV